MNSRIDKFEIHGAKKYLTCTENESFRGFADDANPRCKWANYGVLKQGGNVLSALAHADLFFAGKKAKARLWSAPDALALDEVRDVLTENGWEVEPYSVVRMRWSEPISSSLMANICAVKVFATPVTGAERVLLFESVGNKEYMADLLDKKIKAGAKLFVAYNGQDVPVSLCLVHVYGDLVYVENIYTTPESRRTGYAASLLTAVKQYAQQQSCNEMGFDVPAEQSIDLFERLGFRGTVENRWWAKKESGDAK